MVLSDVQGLNYNEIVEATGFSLGTVKSRLSRGRAKLRDYMLEQRELCPLATVLGMSEEPEGGP